MQLREEKSFNGNSSVWPSSVASSSSSSGLLSSSLVVLLADCFFVSLSFFLSSSGARADILMRRGTVTGSGVPLMVVLVETKAYCLVSLLVVAMETRVDGVVLSPKGKVSTIIGTMACVGARVFFFVNFLCFFQRAQ